MFQQLSAASVFEAFLLATALSVDAFVACFAYGTNKIKIPFKSIVVINIICSLILAAALFLGSLISPFIPPFLTNAICFTLLFALGITRFFESSVKSWLEKSQNQRQNVSFKFLDFNFILQVYTDSTLADKDQSKVLSPMEAASLAIALSLDSLAIGFGAGLTTLNYPLVVILALITGIIAVTLGCFIGQKVSEKLDLNISWISGLLLIALAFMKL